MNVGASRSQGKLKDRCIWLTKVRVEVRDTTGWQGRWEITAHFKLNHVGIQIECEALENDN
jgi:hypothetical protein